MGRKRMSDKLIGIAYKYPADFISRFSAVCEANGVKQREGIRRAMMFCIMENRIPGIEPFEYAPDAQESRPVAGLDETKQLEEAHQELVADQERYVAESASERPAPAQKPPKKTRNPSLPALK